MGVKTTKMNEKNLSMVRMLNASCWGGREGKGIIITTDKIGEIGEK